MRASRYFIPTLREVPSDAEVVSHRLLVRAGMVRKTAAGVYSYLPLGLRTLSKAEQIVREEMNAIGGIEVRMPVLVPKELLDATGRSGVDVLFALKDRGHRDFFLGFTHEEVVTEIVRGLVSSWKQLPLILYQIQTKFRDEPRPRGGLIRGREFTIKDAYSFDCDQAGLDRAFLAHRVAYERIFRRCGVDYLVVDADTGSIGGSESSEFMILASSGEDTVLRCNACEYAANAEKAEVGYSRGTEIAEPAAPASRVVSTPCAHTVAEVCEYLGVPPENLIKTIVVTADGRPVAGLVRGDRELQLTKLGRFLGAQVEMADAATVERVTGAPVGFAGPVGLDGVRIVVDEELRGARDMVVGANKADAHRVGVTPDVDFHVGDWADIRTAVAGDRCSQPGCEGRYTDARGIEVGHIFKLGTKYSRGMGAQVQTESGENIDIVMGCYGLGVSRTVASVVEAHNDADGILWPISIAPFEVVVIPVNPNEPALLAAAEQVYAGLQAAGVDVLLDDRAERSGSKFKDADLIGYPVRVVAGRAVAEGLVEVVLRRDRSARTMVALEHAAEHIATLVAEEHARLVAVRYRTVPNRCRPPARGAGVATHPLR